MEHSDPAPLQLNQHASVESFALSVGLKLEGAEAENGLLLGMIEVCRTKPDPVPFMAEIIGAKGIEAVAFYRDLNLILTRGPANAWPLLVEKLLELNYEIPGVIGPAEASEGFARAWAAAKGCQLKLSMDQGLYQLNEVFPPVGIAGEARLASQADLDLLAEWSHGFYQDALPWELPGKEEIHASTLARIQGRSLYLWEAKGEPVAMTALARPTARGISVNSVYTPPAHRKRGFATALVAAVSAEGLARGKKFCVLYTDLQNPTSNAIYQKVGYRLVCNTRNYTFRY
ncbi:MAG: GNAT family N-acetyltransferase [Proteobacteria bacterium]|nr:MAG: GNAT family N-acetyltransferase [Pseudomonadota bacterium]